MVVEDKMGRKGKKNSIAKQSAVLRKCDRKRSLKNCKCLAEKQL